MNTAQWVKGGNKSTAGVPRLSFRIYDVYDTTKWEKKSQGGHPSRLKDMTNLGLFEVLGGPR